MQRSFRSTPRFVEPASVMGSDAGSRTTPRRAADMALTP